MGKREELDAISAWMNRSFLDWQSRSGTRKSIREFAEYLAVDYSLITKWLSGTAAPGNANVIILGNRLGPEIYDLRGWPRPKC